uniref:Uncharacterized protein n=1 Tax=Rhizophora mucronata TaxID=61149 RepID=A0A2P2QH36_RHIMU
MLGKFSFWYSYVVSIISYVFLKRYLNAFLPSSFSQKNKKKNLHS